jgi:hypothetical protein
VDKLDRVPGLRTISGSPWEFLGRNFLTAHSYRRRNLERTSLSLNQNKGRKTSRPPYTVELDDGGSARGRTVIRCWIRCAKPSIREIYVTNHATTNRGYSEDGGKNGADERT